MNKLATILTRSGRLFLWCAAALGLCVLLCFFAVVGYESYRVELAINRQAAINIAMLIEQDIARNIELYDLSIGAVMDGMSEPDVMQLEPKLRHRTLFDRSATAQGLGALVALNAKGAIVQDSLSVFPRAGNFHDREYFKFHQEADRDRGLYISRPFQARLQGNIWSISLSRRLTNPDGSFDGIVSGTVKLDFIQQLFERVVLGRHGSVALLRDDGVLLVRNVPNDDQIGSDWSKAGVFEHLRHQNSGTFESTGSFDGEPRLYAFQRVGDLPLVVVVGVSIKEIMQSVWPRLVLLAGIFIAMMASVIALVWMLDRELRRRESAEQKAMSLARTDGLTKLANRRHFDETLAREWSRAARTGKALALVILDADHFKTFNDTFGHPAGDRVLVAIAEVIRGALRRGGDLAARYGGEEFAILMADTGAEGAALVAEGIRVSVASLFDKQHAAIAAPITVSLGVASITPEPRMNAGLLVRLADEALYRAKEQGRNRMVTSNAVQGRFVIDDKARGTGVLPNRVA